MNTRKKWLGNTNTVNGVDNSSYYTKEETISDVQANFDFRRYYSAEGKSVTIDGVKEQILVQSHTNPMNEKKEDKKIHCPITSAIHKGSLVVYESEYWLVLSQVDNVGDAYKSAQIYKTNNTLNIYKNNILYSFPCIVGNQTQLNSMDVENSKYQSNIDNENIILISNTAQSSIVDVNDIFTMGIYNYRIKSKTDITNAGFWTIDIEVVLQSPETPIIPTPITNGVQITGSSTIVKNYTEDYTCVFKVNGVVVTDESNFYLTAEDGTSPTTLAEITVQDETANTCTIKGLGYGTVKLFVENLDQTVTSEAFEIQIQRIF